MKKIFGALLLVTSAFATSFAFAEDYKSFNPDIAFTSGVATGLGIVNAKAGVAFVGNFAARILRDGFVPDIVNPVYLEGEFGPMFTEGESIWLYSVHLRWDFIRNQRWTFFGLGGVGGNYYDNRGLGEQFAVHPRVGVGAFLALDIVDIRLEASHEMMLAGVSFPF